MGAAERSAFRLTKGEEILSLYQWNTREAEHYFCSKCGIYTHHVMRGATDTVGINMACLHGVEVFGLAPVSVGGGAKLSLVPQGNNET